MQLPFWIQQLATRLFLFINGAHDPIVVFIPYSVSQKFPWIPFYAWLLYILYKTYAGKTLYFFPIIAALIAVSDQLSTLLKNTTERLRPCHDPALQELVHLVNDKCGGQFGFVSSHAANTMALAVFILLVLPRSNKILRLELLAFVLLNGYSRIYLGAHYPLDVLCGWALGFILAVIFSTLVRQTIKVSAKIAVTHE
ncbi:MAG: phosphatase PAP2 family protein [Bacteroidetes bacterium]|nr:phosphatase PAP2 family protein [Bacteroidota bacterium]